MTGLSPRRGRTFRAGSTRDGRPFTPGRGRTFLPGQRGAEGCVGSRGRRRQQQARLHVGQSVRRMPRRTSLALRCQRHGRRSTHCAVRSSPRADVPDLPPCARVWAEGAEGGRGVCREPCQEGRDKGRHGAQSRGRQLARPSAHPRQRPQAAATGARGADGRVRARSVAEQKLWQDGRRDARHTTCRWARASAFGESAGERGGARALAADSRPASHRRRPSRVVQQAWLHVRQSVRRVSWHTSVALRWQRHGRPSPRCALRCSAAPRRWCADWLRRAGCARPTRLDVWSNSDQSPELARSQPADFFGRGRTLPNYHRVPVSPPQIPPPPPSGFVGGLTSVPVAQVIKRAGYTHTMIYIMGLGRPPADHLVQVSK